MELVTSIYQMTRAFPGEERYGLTSQVRRSAVSVPANIAEGYGRNSTQDYIRSLQIASGSLYEAQTHLEIARNLNFFSKDQFMFLFEKSREIERMLSSLIRKLNQ